MINSLIIFCSTAYYPSKYAVCFVISKIWCDTAKCDLLIIICHLKLWVSLLLPFKYRHELWEHKVVNLKVPYWCNLDFWRFEPSLIDCRSHSSFSEHPSLPLWLKRCWKNTLWELLIKFTVVENHSDIFSNCYTTQLQAIQVCTLK